MPAEAHLSRSRIAKLIEAGAVSRAGEVLTSAKSAVAEGDAIDLAIPTEAESHIGPEDIPLHVVHEDADLVVVEKPAGMVVHPAPGSPRGTLVNALLHHCGDALSGVGGVRRPGIVHRIDKETSGLLVVAKTDRAHHGLAGQFAAHDVHRRYLAICHGAPSQGDPRLMGLPGISRGSGGTIRISTHLARHPTDRQRQAVTTTGGRHAVTHLAVRETFGAAALLSCRLETGRTHQIRVHMRYAGHPLIGDPVYGGQRKAGRGTLGDALAAQIEAFGRQALHAAELGFRHPANGAEMRFESPLPPDLAELLSALRGRAS
ncbi:23S rRNA pseudouridine1911/1915/1917 synthase [Palleronia aestuarii]|uniref:Ribosomal large subunit pseudouridine synthase D n=1 Tax=Palleronia aestuarii TaxID=568105 RepID=A0A2W7NXX1_9RHOB|nr:23S rRNA pseudouridine1911/1915/1917 synthase [Palleronia aestuarii]